MYRCADEKMTIKTDGTGSEFGHKIGRDGGIEQKKRRESGIWEPYCRLSVMDARGTLLSTKEAEEFAECNSSFLSA